jgi:cytochrome c peroxidase
MPQKIAIAFFVIAYAWNTFLVAIELVPMPIVVYEETPKILLGKALFMDTILSHDKSISCFSCHDLYTNGADNSAYTKGVYGRVARFNVPTVYNAVYNFRQLWEGRAKDLKEQALIPIENTFEMGNTVAQVLIDLKADKNYVLWFDEVYEEGITADNLADALVAFESVLITPDAKFDKYLRGDKDILSHEEKEGYRLFKEKGCISCHHGINIGGNLYNKFGIYEEMESKELGRYNITKKEEDKGVFKVPSLRNIARTAPYMHDGRASSLEEAVKIMSRHQLGQPIQKKDLDAIVAFLKTLNGEYPEIIKELNVSKK